MTHGHTKQLDSDPYKIPSTEATATCMQYVGEFCALSREILHCESGGRGGECVLREREYTECVCASGRARTCDYVLESVC